MILGIDVGGSFTRLGVVDKDLNVFHFHKVNTQEVVEDFSAFIRNFVANIPPINGVVMGFPGVVNPMSQSLIKIPNQPQLSSLDIPLLSQHINLPILIDKDTHLLFHYDRFQKKLNLTPNILGFYLGTGLGNVIVLNHQIIRGDHHSTSELGHLKVRDHEVMCPCGLKGCYETKVSGHYLKALHEKLFTSPYDKIFIDHLQHPMVQAFIEDFCEAMMIEIHLLDVNTIIIGGGVVQMNGFPKDMIVKHLNQSLRHESALPLNIHFTDENPHAGVIGAAIWGYQYWEKTL